MLSLNGIVRLGIIKDALIYVLVSSIAIDFRNVLTIVAISGIKIICSHHDDPVSPVVCIKIFSVAWS